MFSSFVHAQVINQNKLPPCPRDQTVRYHNCFGSNTSNGNKYVGEFKDGEYHGQGTITFLSGNKYVGDFKVDQPNGQGTFTFANGEKYVGEFKDGKLNGQGTYTFANGDIYVGEFKNDIKHGRGTYTYLEGDKYLGEFKDDKLNGQGTYTFANGKKYIGEFRDGIKHGLAIMMLADGSWHYGEWRDNLPQGKGIRFYSDSGKREEGIWENNTLIRAAKVDLPDLNNNAGSNTDRTAIDRERQQLAEERRRLEDEKRQRQQASSSQRINLQVTNSQPNSDGLFFIDIKTNADTASLLIDGKEEGGKSDGNYTLKRIARAGQSSTFKIVATDIYGNTDTKTINVTRTISGAKATYADLNPTNIKRRSDRDAVAIIIGISDYKNLPKADFANDDARVFYDYALRALSIKPENIKLLIDSEANDVQIVKTFKNWLPINVNKDKTDIYVFYSGHGMPSSDGKSLYLLPQGVDKDLLERTAINQQEIISSLQASKPKSVTMFIDSCYSGLSRTGETLLASARPISLKSKDIGYPPEFTVISASSPDQISSSSPELRHGIFSFYLMKGMEGDADINKDGKITAGEMQQYVSDKVQRQAMSMNRKQEPQLIGDANRVLVGR